MNLKTGGTRWKEFDAPDNISDEEASTIETSPFSPMNTETMILGGAFQSQWNFQTRSVPLTRIVEDDVSIGSNLQTVGPNRQDNGNKYMIDDNFPLKLNAPIMNYLNINNIWLSDNLDTYKVKYK